jgi:hypothetical protein
MKLLLTSLLLTLSISAANLSGKWTGTFIDTSEGNKSESAMVILTQDGNTLTGTAGPNADEQMAISNGKVDGNNVTFDVKAGEVTVHFTLQLVDKHLKGSAKAEANGESKSATIDLTRAE